MGFTSCYVRMPSLPRPIFAISLDWPNTALKCTPSILSYVCWKNQHIPFFIWGNYCGISVCSALEIESSCCQFIDFLYFTARWSMRRTGGDNSGLAFLFPVWQVAAVAMRQRQYIGNMLLLYFSILLMHLLWAYYGRRNKTKSTLSNLPCWLYFDESNYTYSLYVAFGASLPKASFGCLLKWFNF